MLMSRLDELLETDTVSRWRIISISAVAVAAWGGLMTALMHKPLAEVQPEACVFGAVIFAAQVFMYCLKAEGTAVRRTLRTAVTESSPARRLVLSAASAGILVT